jgi:hypothetical protein
MNPRVWTTIAGLVMLILGALALFYPEFVMAHVLGFDVDPSHTANFVRGEVRAVYGGLFVVAGTATVLAAMDPAANRARILFVGLLWLGTCGGRLFGVFADGDPGVWGWLSVVFELVMGGALVTVAQTAATPTTRFQPQMAASQPAASPRAEPLPPGVPPV